MDPALCHSYSNVLGSQVEISLVDGKKKRFPGVGEKYWITWIHLRSSSASWYGFNDVRLARRSTGTRGWDPPSQGGRPEGQANPKLTKVAAQHSSWPSGRAGARRGAGRGLLMKGLTLDLRPGTGLGAFNLGAWSSIECRQCHDCPHFGILERICSAAFLAIWSFWNIMIDPCRAWSFAHCLRLSGSIRWLFCALFLWPSVFLEVLHAFEASHRPMDDLRRWVLINSSSSLCLMIGL